jgi:hypothetical protein
MDVPGAATQLARENHEQSIGCCGLSGRYPQLNGDVEGVYTQNPRPKVDE